MMPAKIKIAQVTLTTLLLALASCKRSATAGHTPEREGEPPVIEVADDDAEMTKAIQDARSTVDVFVKHLQDPGPDQTYFSIKGQFKEGDKSEHMWLSEVSFKDGEFHGKIGNEPNSLRKIKLGDSVKVAKGEISDWMIIEDEELRGGYSMRLLRNRMSPEERKRFDASIGMTVNETILPRSK